MSKRSMIKTVFIIILCLFLEPAGAAPFLNQAGKDSIEITVCGGGIDQKVGLVRNGDGSFRYRITRVDGTSEWLSPEAFAQLTYGEDALPAPLAHRLFNISSAAGLPWVVLGLLGQLLYTARMTVQWIASERRKKSVVPPVFWWLSLLAAGALTVYFTWRRDIVGILGNCIGGFVYVRNLCFISKAGAKSSLVESDGESERERESGEALRGR